MANLSAHIGFNVFLNFKSGIVSINSVALSPMPAGIAALDISATIKQPDGINGQVAGVAVASIYPLSFSAARSLRMTVEEKPQNGRYIVVLTVKAAGYENTVITKEFILDYARPSVIIGNNFDLITPSLKLKDESLYQVPGINITNIVREWDIRISGVADITPGNSQEVDLIHSGQYWDAGYFASLTAKINYSTGYSFLTLYDEVSGDSYATANTIPPFSTFPDILQSIADISSGVSAGCCDCASCDTHEYREAYVLFREIERSICGPVTSALLTNIDLFLKIYYRLTGPYVNTESAMPAYDRSFCVGGDPGANDYIQNRTTPQAGANINISGGATLGDIPHWAAGEIPMYLISQAGRIMHLTEAEMLLKFSGSGGSGVWGSISGDLADQADLVAALGSKITANAPITGATKAKITYNANGLVTSGEDLSEADVPVLPISKISGLSAVLSAKSDIGHVHGISEVTGLVAALAAKADDASVVKTTGDQAVAGIKTFASSPIVPTPTNNTQAANKKYVDDTFSGLPGTGSFLKKNEDDSNGVYKLTLGSVEVSGEVKLAGIPASLIKPEIVGVLPDKTLVRIPYVGVSGGSVSFNATSDWTDIGAHYEKSYSHNLNSQNLSVTVWDNTTGSLVMVLVEEIEQTDLNTITIRVPKLPDNRFAGKLVVQKN